MRSHPRVATTFVAGLLFLTTFAACGSDDPAHDDAASQDPGDADRTPEDTVTSAPPASIAPDASARPGVAPGPEPVGSDVVVADDVAVRIVALEAADVDATAPFERSGPGVVVTVEVVNASGDAVDLTGVTVDLLDADGAPAGTVTDPTRPPLPDHADAGATVTGRYVFTVPPQLRDPVEITVVYPDAEQVVTATFTGAAPGA